jgi:hypothetical protein
VAVSMRWFPCVVVVVSGPAPLFSGSDARLD